ncbi:MAG: phosphoribosylanthranilate isomerase [Crocinitomicaceae bacterium]|jgi:phosphoribosylanthranilate isomerase
MASLRTRIKICGITRVEDALKVVDAGADAIGLVFYDPSPRSVRINLATEIAAAVPAFVSVVALFVDPTKDYVQEVLNNVRIDLIQFHGDEENDFCSQFKTPFIKAIRVRQASDVVASSLRFPDSVGILLDSYKPGVPGGTGESFDWSLIPKNHSNPIILAGGLTPENVASAINDVQPFAVDISGGVEAAKGIKDSEKIKEFVSEVYDVDYSKNRNRS